MLQDKDREHSHIIQLQMVLRVQVKAVVTVARELAGFVWAIGRQVQTSGWQGIDEAVFVSPKT